MVLFWHKLNYPNFLKTLAASGGLFVWFFLFCFLKIYFVRSSAGGHDILSWLPSATLHKVTTCDVVTSIQGGLDVAEAILSFKFPNPVPIEWTDIVLEKSHTRCAIEEIIERLNEEGDIETKFYAKLPAKSHIWPHKPFEKTTIWFTLADKSFVAVWAAGKPLELLGISEPLSHIFIGKYPDRVACFSYLLEINNIHKERPLTLQPTPRDIETCKMAVLLRTATLEEQKKYNSQRVAHLLASSLVCYHEIIFRLTGLRIFYEPTE